MEHSQYWLLWDGECEFCGRVVQWIQRKDAAGRLRAVPYQRAPRPPMTDQLAERCRRAVQVYTPRGEILSAGRASLCVLELIGHRRLARVAARPPLIWLVELGYWVVARNRRFFSRLLFGPGNA